MINIINKNLAGMEKIYRKGLGLFQSHTPLVGVYGVTSVGKSTFLNALLKNSEFKVGLGETTKQLHIIKDFENQKYIDFEKVSLPIEYIFKDLPILKHFSIVDVPGSNKSFSDEDLEVITKKLDVIIWVFDIHGDISERDVHFLKNVILKNMVKTVVILNKIDSGMDDIDFDENREKEEFIDDIKSRQTSILNFFKHNQAEELLVTVLPMSAKKLFYDVTKRKNKNLEKQHRTMEKILVSVAKSAFMQKEIFRNSYDEVKKVAKKEIDVLEKEILYEKIRKLETVLDNISDDDIIENNFHQDKLLDKTLPTFKIKRKYRNELKKIHKKIEDNL